MSGSLKTWLDNVLHPAEVRSQLLCTQTRQLASMLDAGMSLTRALRILNEQCVGSRRLRSAKRIWSAVLRGVESGTPFSECLEQFPETFSQIHVGLIRAGEVSGQLVPVMERLASYQERTARLRHRLANSLVYPAVVLTVALGISAALLIFVVPKFVAIFLDLLEGHPLPLVTRMVIAASDVASHYFPHAVVAAVVLVFVGKRLLRTERGLWFYDWAVLKLPPFAPLVRKVLIARFSATLSTLLDAGVPALSALETLEQATGNLLMKRVVHAVHASVLEGAGFTEPLENSGVFPIMVVRWVEVGETTRTLPDMLRRLAIQYEQEVDNTLESLIALVEPLMIVFLACVVGTIVLALFAPLVTIIENIGAG